MARIPLPLPESTWRWISGLTSGPVLDLLWRVFITAVIVGVAYLLVVASPIIGGAIAGAALGALVSARVRQAVRDLYARDFGSIKL